MAKHNGDGDVNDDKRLDPIDDEGENAAYTQMFRDTWQQNLGNQPQAELVRVSDTRRLAAEQSPQQLEKQSPYHDMQVGNYTVRIYNQGGYVDVLNGNGSRITRGRIDENKGELRLRIPNETLHIDPSNYSIERRDLQGRRFEKVYPDGARDNYNQEGRLATRTYPDGVKDLFDNAGTHRETRFPDGPDRNKPYEGGSYNRFDEQGRLQETNDRGTLTKYDAQGRQKEVRRPDTKQWKLDYGTDGRVANFEVSEKGNVVERGQRATDGTLKIERRQADGSFKQVDSLKDRADVLLTPGHKLEYLDREGYSQPDESGRRIKRDTRTISAPALTNDGPRELPVNPIRSIKTADGTQVDFGYASDARQGGPGGPDAMTNYTVRKDGKIVEFAAMVPPIPGTQQDKPVWLEFKSKPGQPPIPDAQVDDVKRLLAPGSPEEMLTRQRELTQKKPLKDYVPQRSALDGASLDQFGGQTISQLRNGDKIVSNHAGSEYTLESMDRGGDKVVRTPSGKEIRTAPDANPEKANQGDRTTITDVGPDGKPRLTFHHARSDQAHLMVRYGDDGKVSEVQTDKNGVRTKLSRGNGDSWSESRLVSVQDGKETWQPTGKSYPMRIELVGDDSPLRIGGERIQPGSIVMTQMENGKVPGRRIITPRGQEIIGRAAGEGNNDTIFLFEARQRELQQQRGDVYEQGRYPQDRPPGERYAPRDGRQQGEPLNQNPRDLRPPQRQQGQRPRLRM